ncbi:MAG: DUF4412 domain-containing protein [Deltaproteobacteria bacterium]|nr:DUF4412 domain-containing protein [Deltaproteobacteria bacterium]
MKKFLLRFVCFILSSLAWVQNSQSEPYSADLVTVAREQRSTSKVYVSEGRLRTEATMGKVQIVTIARLDEKIVYVLLPVQKLFVEKPLSEKDGILAYVSDPNAKRELVGTETLNGQTCDKYKMMVREKMFYVWITKDSHTPLMMFSPESETRIEWSNVQVGPQPADLFKPPGDFQKFTTPPVVIEKR